MTLEDFEALRKALQDASCDATLLEEWYLQDDNDEAQQYFLKPATSLSGEWTMLMDLSSENAQHSTCTGIAWSLVATIE